MIKPAEDAGFASAVVSVEDCVSCALRDLGREVYTFGPALHETNGFVLKLILPFLQRFVTIPDMKEMVKKETK